MSPAVRSGAMTTRNEVDALRTRRRRLGPSLALRVSPSRTPLRRRRRGRIPATGRRMRQGEPAMTARSPRTWSPAPGASMVNRARAPRAGAARTGRRPRSRASSPRMTCPTGSSRRARVPTRSMPRWWSTTIRRPSGAPSPARLPRRPTWSSIWANRRPSVACAGGRPQTGWPARCASRSRRDGKRWKKAAGVAKEATEGWQELRLKQARRRAVCALQLHQSGGCARPGWAGRGRDLARGAGRGERRGTHPGPAARPIGPRSGQAGTRACHVRQAAQREGPAGKSGADREGQAREQAAGPETRTGEVQSATKAGPETREGADHGAGAE